MELMSLPRLFSIVKVLQNMNVYAGESVLFWSAIETNLQESHIYRQNGDPNYIVEHLDYNNSIKIEYSSAAASKIEFGALSVDTRAPLSIFLHSKNGGGIHSVDLNPDTSTSDVIRTASELVEDIAVDWVNHNLYYTDPLVGVVLVSYTNNRFAVIIHKVAALYGIDVDPNEGFIFYADGDTGRIYQASLTGKNHKIFPMAPQGKPTSLVVDSVTTKLYWLDEESAQLLVASYVSGSTHTVIWSDYQIGLGTYSALEINNDYLFLASRSTVQMLMVYTNGTVSQTINIPSVTGRTLGVVVASDQRQPKTTSDCSTNNGGCPHICTHSVQDQVECLCQFGYEIQTDDTTCETDLVFDNFLLFVDSEGKSIYQLDTTTNNIHAVPIPIKNDTTPESVAYDSTTKSLYWAERQRDQIMRINLETHVSDVFFQLSPGGTGQGIATDSESGSVYYTDANYKIIGRIITSNMKHELVLRVNSDEKPLAIQLDTSNRHIYWSDFGDIPKIEKADLADGDNRKVIVSTDLNTPAGLALDLDAGHIYWADRGLDKVERSNLDGSERELVVKSIGVSLGLALDNNHIYVSLGRSVIKIDKSDKTRTTVAEPYFSSIFGMTYYSSTSKDKPRSTITAKPTTVDSRSPLEHTAAAHLNLSLVQIRTPRVMII